MNIIIVNGPNLNLLGEREPEIYGSESLSEINLWIESHEACTNLNLEFFQSNSEGLIIDFIHSKREDADYLIINPGALTHTSVSLRDALLGVGIPFIEVHLSNVHAREEFRQHSYLSDIAVGVITGFGSQGYSFALSVAAEYVKEARG